MTFELAFTGFVQAFIVCVQGGLSIMDEQVQVDCNTTDNI